ncbi:HTH-type transcriptional repressor ComR [Acinetobacter baumannii]|nr:HTH-type transcriptional repressor ComR [Acinetobacter baumannii]
MHDPVLESHHLVCEKPQTRRGIERRLALLLSATELFLEKGYDAVSLDDIVNHAGGSKTSIYKYFGNKDGLFTAICDYRREMFFKDTEPYRVCRRVNILRDYPDDKIKIYP